MPDRHQVYKPQLILKMGLGSLKDDFYPISEWLLAEQDREIQRIAYQIWVLAKFSEGGPEQFVQEAEQIIKRRGLSRLDAIQEALERHENGEPPPSNSDKDES